MTKYTSDEAVERCAAGLTDYLDVQTFAKMHQGGESNFMTVDLRGADLSNITLDQATFYGSNLSKVNLSQAILRKCNLNESNLTDANLRAADLRNSRFHQAKLNRANLSGANLSGAQLNGVILTEAVLIATNLEQANLSEANLRDANLQDAKLKDTNLRWANLSGANMVGVDLNGADLGGAIMPDGLRSGTVIEAEAVSLEEAKAQIMSQIAKGSLLIAERIISDGQPVIRSRKTFEVEAFSLAEARNKVKAQTPEGFQLLSENILTGAKSEIVRGVADGSSEKGGNIKLVKAGSKGFLGFGAKPNQYEVEFGIVEWPRAKVTVRSAPAQQELSLLAEAVASGSMTGGPLLQHSFDIAKNIILQAPDLQTKVIVPFFTQVHMISAILGGMIAAGDYAATLTILDKAYAFLNALSSRINYSDTREFCAGMLGSTLASRYGDIMQATSSREIGEKAVTCAEQGLELKSSVALIRNASRLRRFLAVLYYEHEDISQTIVHLQRAVAIDPEYGDAWWLLSLVYQEVGEMEECLNCCGRAADLGNIKARQILTQILHS